MFFYVLTVFLIYINCLNNYDTVSASENTTKNPIKLLLLPETLLTTDFVTTEPPCLVNLNCFNFAPDIWLDTSTSVYFHLRYIKRKFGRDVRIHKYYKLSLLILSGDISLNPGPAKFPCGQCYRPVAKTHRAVLCEACCLWFHIKCENISASDYIELDKSDDPWTCKQCSNFHFTESFFEDQNISFCSNSEVNSSTSTAPEEIFDDLLKLKKKNPKKFICAYLNINSLRHKFASIHDLLSKNIVDLLFIAETKLDNTFVDAQFMVDNYLLWRADRNEHGGGVAAYLRSDIAGERKCDYEFQKTESITIEVKLNNIKWLFSGAYKPPSLSNDIFQEDLSSTIDKLYDKYDKYVLLGDLNCDMLDSNKSQVLKSVCDIFDLKNMIKKPTCNAANSKPSLLDVILTNDSSNIGKVCNFNCGLSDVHNMIAFQINSEIPQCKTKWSTYRSFKKFDSEDFNRDLAQKLSSSHADSVQNDINTQYNNFSSVFIEVANKHAPLKKKKCHPKPAPFMNKALKQAIYKKRMLHNKYQHYSTSKNWEKFRQQRNLVNGLKRRSINKYFIERCVGGSKSKAFWPTIKPFLTNKGSIFHKDIILCENESMINDQQQICDTFNKLNYFVNVAENIGNNSMPVNDTHPSISKISENKLNNSMLNFTPVDEIFVSKQIDKLCTKKATGNDGISSKLVKLAKPTLIKPVTNLINKSFEISKFPDSLKMAQVAPIHKKNSTLEKGNYRPVSILPIMSKLFERAINTQLTEFFNHHFNSYLSAFRPGYGCQSALLKIIEDWKLGLDQNKYIAAVLMDLSKAFDCLPHDLMLLKLKYYGLSESALNLIKCYLSNRKQCVKIGSLNSNFLDIYKGVPQGSILGPVLFNIFINDIFHFVNNSELYNYADDNTLSKADYDLKNVIQSLEKDSANLIEWFSDNQMKANPDKFQAIAIGTKTKKENISFNFDEINITCEDDVKLLGVTIDFKLKFDIHVANICKKASRQINVLKRIGRNLCKLGKLNIYYSFILSNFNYCPLTWHFCGEVNTKKLEKIQERALRFIYNDYNSNYDALLEKSKMPTLKIRRLRSIALETFKIVNKQGPVYLHDLLNIKQQQYCFRYSKTAEIPQVRTSSYGVNSFRSMEHISSTF